MRIGIDLGGTKTEVLALDEQDQVLYQARIATPKDDYHASLRAIQQLVLETEAQCGIRGTVGIGTPGALSPATGRLRNCNSTCLNDQPFLQDISQLLEREVRLSNDANCFALSEATDGAASNYQVVLGVILGTGCGAGIVIDKKILQGAHAIAGEWGHNPLPLASPQELASECWCGRQACIETFVSGPALEYHYRVLSQQSKSCYQIVELAEQGDAQAESVLHDYERRLAKSLALVINILDPDVVVLGGGLSNIQRLYENVAQLWSAYIFSDRVSTRLIAPQFGDSSGVRGAAWLWPKT